MNSLGAVGVFFVLIKMVSFLSAQPAVALDQAIQEILRG